MEKERKKDRRWIKWLDRKNITHVHLKIGIAKFI